MIKNTAGFENKTWGIGTFYSMQNKTMGLFHVDYSRGAITSLIKQLHQHLMLLLICKCGSLFRRLTVSETAMKCSARKSFLQLITSLEIQRLS